MFKEFFRLYDIGKGLGLSKKEINNIIIFDNSRHSILYKILIIIAASIIGVLMFVIASEAGKNIYPANALYSTIKVKDFKKRTKK